MSAALQVVALWLGFAATHIALSSNRLRPRLVGAVGERPFQGLYSLISLAFLVPLCSVYFANKHSGPWLWVIEPGQALEWILDAGMGVAFVLLFSGVLRPSPASFLPGDPTPGGIHRITRHPVHMALGIFGLLHLLPNGSTTDVAFFGGLALFALVGTLHQDRRKLASGDEEFRRFYEGTPFLPFTGRETWRGLCELRLVPLVLAVIATVGVRYFHGALFGP